MYITLLYFSLSTSTKAVWALGQRSCQIQSNVEASIGLVLMQLSISLFYSLLHVAPKWLDHKIWWYSKMNCPRSGSWIKQSMEWKYRGKTPLTFVVVTNEGFCRDVRIFEKFPDAVLMRGNWGSSLKVDFQQPLQIKIKAHRKYVEQPLKKNPLKPLDLKSPGPGLSTGSQTTGESVWYLFPSAEEQLIKIVVHWEAKENRKRAEGWKFNPIGAEQSGKLWF